MVAYYAMPKPLFEDPRYKDISVDAKTLYACMRDRFSLSTKNDVEGHGIWHDERGTFILMARKTIAELLNRSLPTVRKIIRELKAVGLLIERRLGQGNCNRIYVQLLEGDSIVAHVVKNLSPVQENSLPTGGNQSFLPEGKNGDGLEGTKLARNNLVPNETENNGFGPGKRVNRNQIYGNQGGKNDIKYPAATVPAQRYTQRDYSAEFWADLYHSWEDETRNWKGKEA